VIGGGYRPTLTRFYDGLGLPRSVWDRRRLQTRLELAAVLA
jgi:hypothetical protein